MPEQSTEVEEVVVGPAKLAEPSKYHATSIGEVTGQLRTNLKSGNVIGAAYNLGKFGAEAVADHTNGFGTRNGDFTPEMAARAQQFKDFSLVKTLGSAAIETAANAGNYKTFASADTLTLSVADQLSDKFNVAAKHKPSELVEMANGVAYAAKNLDPKAAAAYAAAGAGQGVKSELDLTKGHINSIKYLADRGVPGAYYSEERGADGKIYYQAADATAVPRTPGAEPVYYTNNPKWKGEKQADAVKGLAASKALEYSENLDIPDASDPKNQDPDIERDLRADEYDAMVKRVAGGGEVNPSEPKVETAQNNGPANTSMQPVVAAPAPAPAA